MTWPTKSLEPTLIAPSVPHSRLTSSAARLSFFRWIHPYTFMKYITQTLKFTVPVLLLAGCSKPTSTATKADFQMAEDMSQITNTMFQLDPKFKKAESGELGSEISFPVTIGMTNSEQRHYILTWKEHKWQISPTNY